MFAARRALAYPSFSARLFSVSHNIFATTPKVTYPKSQPIAPKTTARAATSKAGQGNPDIVEAYPTTANEVDVKQLTEGEETGELPDVPPGSLPMDWYTSYHGLSSQPFPKEAAEILMAPIDPLDVEVKPDGLLYLPEIKYRRILNRAFGPGGWGLAPRSGINVSPKVVSREYALVCLGRIARGEQEYFDQEGIATATEAAKSNALMRCCKDLGIASELWCVHSFAVVSTNKQVAHHRDPRFIREFKAKYCVEAFVEHIPSKKVVGGARMPSLTTPTRSLHVHRFHIFLLPPRDTHSYRVRPKVSEKKRDSLIRQLSTTPDLEGQNVIECSVSRIWSRFELGHPLID
ncbi:genome maintenance protein [Rhizoctonia solani AG-1 IA]|uniref:Mitochondrial genome maintenance protein MGM101 n=1 Tax=Thanatephorus cucumeris (strain AG1-IA) TaxID=983506 RepID=L8WJL4_THACA|nr:genome maintenance protein [Rhizoctonia solani AG-1 IA]